MLVRNSIQKGTAMTYWKLASSTAAIALLSGAAFADVTPEDVWASWQKEMTSTGQTLTTGSAASDGDAFVVTDLVVTSGKTKISTAQASVKRLASARARIVGALLSRYDARTAGYGYRYESYYGYGNQPRLGKG